MYQITLLALWSTGTSLLSIVMCADHPGLTFTLSLVRTEPTYNQPMQQWSFVSDFAVSTELKKWTKCIRNLLVYACFVIIHFLYYCLIYEE